MMLGLLKRWWLRWIVKSPKPSYAPPMPDREGWSGKPTKQWTGSNLGGEAFARRVYGERRTIITDHIHRQGGSNIGEDDESRTFQLDKIYRQHQE
jgi:hypothetical protein